MNSIQEIVNAKVAEMVSSGVIQQKIESSIQEAIESAIASQFRSFGNVTKQLEKLFDEELKINSKNIDFDSYNQVMLSAVKMKLNEYFAAESSSKFMKQLDELFQPAPKEMDIHDLVQQVVNFWKSDNESYYDWSEHAEVEIKDGGTAAGGISLKLWINDTGRYSSKAKELELYIRDGEIRINHNMNYNPTCMFGADALIFRLYAAGTKITGIESFDECNVNLYVGLEEEY